MLWQPASQALDEGAGRSTESDIDDVILFEDFEALDYKKNWQIYWGQAPGTATVTAPPEHIFAGQRSAYLQAEKGQHKSRGAGEYVPDTPIDDVAYTRLYLRLDDNFDPGTANQLKLFGIRGGAELKHTYGGAGKKPTGLDKFSAIVSLNRQRSLHLYTYHLGQRGRFGDWLYCDKFFCNPVLDPGKWYCLELMLKNNTPGRDDGELILWQNDKLVIHVDKLRFRDNDTVKIRRFSIINYFGGGGKRNTSPKDQRLYIDNYVISRTRVGCR